MNASDINAAWSSSGENAISMSSTKCMRDTTSPVVASRNSILWDQYDFTATIFPEGESTDGGNPTNCASPQLLRSLSVSQLCSLAWELNRMGTDICTAYNPVSASLESSSCTGDHSPVLIMAAKSKIWWVTLPDHPTMNCITNLRK